MSEFFDARICKCPKCGTKFASCEGTLCDCHLFEDDNSDESTDDSDDI